MWHSPYALLALALLTLRTTQAYSYAANRVSRVDTVQDIDFITTLNAHEPHDAHLVLTLAREGRRIRFELTPNLDLLAPTLNVQHVQSDGSYRAVAATGDEHFIDDPTRFYKGSAFLREDEARPWARAGWARLSLREEDGHHLIEGAFRLHGDSYHISTDASYRRARHADDPAVPAGKSPFLVVWRDSDIIDDPFRSELLRRDGDDSPFCGTNTIKERGLDLDDDHPSFGAISARQNIGFDPADTIGSTAGCPSSTRVALLGIATDCTYTREFQDLNATRRNILEQINTASQLYENTFNIRLAIQNLTISDASCPARPSTSTPWNIACTSGFDISSRLSSFSQWRGQFDDGNAIWTLLSACNTGQTVGIAWLRSVCSRGVREQRLGGSTQFVASTNVVVRTRAEWQVIAHEMGHNFGATHDCWDQDCQSAASQRASDCCPLSSDTCNAGGGFLMNPVTNDNFEEFSGCSVGLICTGMGRNLIDTSCFVGPDDAPAENDIRESECGNGIVEGTEDCDCGGPEGCPPNSCCNPETCRLRDGAVCDPTNDKCCTDSCAIAETGFVCRSSTSECDPEETCDGRSSTCPGDLFRDDGESCGNSTVLQCASGLCTSRDEQCRIAFDENVVSCDFGSCRLSCNSSNTCGVSNQDFLDGTPCEGGGRCMTGFCETEGGRGGGGNQGGNNGSWFDNNRSLVIGLAAGIGGLIVIIILSCMISSFRKKRNAKVLSKRWPTNPYMTQHLQQQQYGGQQYGGQQWPQQQQGQQQWPQQPQSPHQGGSHQSWQPPPGMVRYG
ncbi:ADAM family of metalloprotease-like protein ADM-B [Plectosphaerella plurivora]|uniref:Disintegrin and metalloproteinase domain-containing protein B n=1 Tax=Plectosphaerella plurivora TaxID=936078 RepID=A0A9P8VE45_9PEZI|nr:ADAM family of metalloprotease-like protein ADM-B [Plectosphaerella plurivora]